MRRIGLFLLLGAAVLGTGCIIEPPSDIQVQYTINSVSDGGANIVVNYQVYNSGEYDLDNIQVYIEIDPDGDNVYEYAGWSSKFDLNEGASTTRDFYYLDGLGIGVTGGAPTSRLARIARVGMDNPPDE